MAGTFRNPARSNPRRSSSIACRQNVGARHALEDITGRFEPGSLTAIVGPNGAGKSTLLNVLAGLKQPRSGTILLHGIIPIRGDVDSWARPSASWRAFADHDGSVTVECHFQGQLVLHRGRSASCRRSTRSIAVIRLLCSSSWHSGSGRVSGHSGRPPYDLMTEVAAALRTVGMQDSATTQIGDLSGELLCG
jgi:ATPase subunit of ABC transporter with duplicated ATPase domains